MSEKISVALDFDGVLHKYAKGYTGPKPEEPPVRKAQWFVDNLIDSGCEVIIFSHRAHTQAGKVGIEEWLIEHGFPQLEVTDKKPASDVYILDDRGFRFEGDFDAAFEFIMDDKARRPWNRKGDAKAA